MDFIKTKMLGATGSKGFYCFHSRNPIISLQGEIDAWGNVKTLYMALNASVHGTVTVSREDSVAGLEQKPLSWPLEAVPSGLILRDSDR